MKLVSVSRQAPKERHHEYRERKGSEYRVSNAARMRKARGDRVTEFVCVDGEGSGKGKNHKYILLGVGQEQYENPAGICWKEAFDFLYKQYERQPHAAFVGFYLGYDFNQILKGLPEDKAWDLLTRDGKASRASKKEGQTHHYPVRCDGWEIDMLGSKRLQIRPMCCSTPWACKCKKNGWMSVCDTGPFFQAGFLSVIDPKGWSDDPDGPVCTEKEYALVEDGKSGRGDDVLDDDMRMYNRLENEILARVMVRYEKGLKANGVRLKKNQWYGPGAAAQVWLKNRGVPKRTEVEEWIPEWARETCKGSYYGGWFEIFSHGGIPGTTYNYDINSAYPYAIARLPCIREGHGTWESGEGNIGDTRPFMLCHIHIKGRSNRVGPVPYRRKAGNILRPNSCSGWYWLDEIQASEKAGLVDSYTVDRWVSYTPHCKCQAPLTEVQELYDYRLSIGKNSAAGKAAKLIANSIYGKFAQNVGAVPFGNWFYASRITASCRTQILSAIASHSRGPNSVLMVATDGIVFDTKHEKLTIGKGLGEWEETEYRELVLFMPGVYWSKQGKDNVLKVKTRGVPKAKFREAIDRAEWRFWQQSDAGRYNKHAKVMKTYGEGSCWPENDWPMMRIPLTFSMTSCLQALMRGDWSQAGLVAEEEDEFGFPISKIISSDPGEKRGKAKWYKRTGRIDSFTLDVEEEESTPYRTMVTPEPMIDQDGIGLDMTNVGEITEYIAAMRCEVEAGEWKEEM